MEKYMNRFKSLIAISTFTLLVLGLPAIASAQYNGQNDPYGRNGGYNNGGYNNGNGGYNNGQYGNYGDLKNRSKDFKKEVDRQNGGIFGGFGRSNDRYLRDLADQFKKAADRLEGQFRNGQDQYRSENNARQVLDLGSQLDQEMRRSRSNGYLQNEWYGINNDLRIVSNTYGYNNRNNRNNPNNGYPQNGNGNGRYNNNRPSWWPF